MLMDIRLPILAALVSGSTIVTLGMVRPVLAAEPNTATAPAANSAAQTGAKAEPLPVVVAMDTADCRRFLVQKGQVAADYQPPPGVNYQPGVDVNGKPVAPADLPGSTGYQLPQTLTLDLKIPFARLLGSRTPPRMGQAEVGLGKMTLDIASGRLSLDGAPVMPEAEDAVILACQEKLRPKP